MKSFTGHMIALSGIAVVLVAPVVVQAETVSEGRLSLFQVPKCGISGNLTPIDVSIGRNGRVATDSNGLISAGEITISCNTFLAAVSIGSDAMVNPAAINEAEVGKYTNSIDFAAYARWKIRGDRGWRIASRPGVRGAWSGDYIGFVPVRTLEVFATQFESSSKMPVAGNYKGRICITVSPTGLPAPTLRQGTGGCAS